MSITNQKFFKLYCCMFVGCGKEYSLKFNLKRHVEVNHFKSKEVECEICQKRFSIKQNYLEHKSIHLNQKPYSCSLCFTCFRHKSTFLKHKRENLCKRNINRSYSECSDSEFEADDE